MMGKHYSIEEIRALIKEKYAPQTNWQKKYPRHTYKEYEALKSPDYPTLAQTQGLKIGVNKMGPIVALTACIFYLVTFPFLNPEKETSTFIALTYILSAGACVWSLYILFFSTKVVFSTDSISFTFENETYLWDDIVTTGILRVHGKNSTYYVILGMRTGGIVKLPIEKAAIGPEALISIIHLNRHAQ
jgi:hypothetical protein